MRRRAAKWRPQAPHTRCWSAGGLSLRNGVVRLGWWLASAHRRASQRQTVRVLHEAIEDGIRQGWVTSSEGWMPGFDRQLADHQGRTDLAAVVDDLQQILGLDDAGWRQEEVVEDQQANPGELPKTAHVAAVATAERQLR